MKRIEVEKQLRNLKDIFDEENEEGGCYLLFVYYAGRCVVVDGKKHTVHGVEQEKKNNFDIESWLESLTDLAFVVGMFDCCRVHD